VRPEINKGSTQQTAIVSGDKVVCIDDRYQRVDLADAPDGLLIRGQVYCVSGVSDCGGVLLAGRRAISLRTAREIGFQHSRFVRLDQFRERFPQGLPPAPSEWEFLQDDLPGERKAITLPAIEGLEEPKPLIHRVVEVLEALDAKFHEREITPPWLQSGHWPDQSPEQVQLELRALLRSPQLSAYLNHSWTFWSLLLRRQRPILWFCRNRSPVATVLFLMCRGSTLSERFLDGDLRERDFPILTGSAGRLSIAPIRVCDARERDSFCKVLFDAQTLFDYAFCDWRLEGEELAGAYRMTRDSQITFLCPPQEPTNCNTP